jgi:hypothetical protein
MNTQVSLLNYNKLNDRETKIVKNQVKSLYNRLKFRKFAQLAHLNPASGAYKAKLKNLFEEEIENERLLYVYVYNNLRSGNTISVEDLGVQAIFDKDLSNGQLADRLRDSLWHTKKRVEEITKLMCTALELLDDQGGNQSQIKNTVLDMINYVCETKKTLLDAALKEDDAPVFDIASLNPFGKPIKIEIVNQSASVVGGKRSDSKKRSNLITRSNLTNPQSYLKKQSKRKQYSYGIKKHFRRTKKRHS